jgi:hypothetical protein
VPSTIEIARRALVVMGAGLLCGSALGCTISYSETGFQGDGSQPRAVTVAGQVLTMQHGGTGGDAFSDLCPAGQVVVGFQGYVNVPPSPAVDRIQTVCGRLMVSGSAPATATIASGATLPYRGMFGNTTFSRICPADQVIIGFGGRSGALIDQLAFRCAALVVPAGGTTAIAGPIIPLAPIGEEGGSSFAATDCPAGYVARGTTGRSGFWLDALALVCGTVTVAY